MSQKVFISLPFSPSHVLAIIISYIPFESLKSQNSSCEIQREILLKTTANILLPYIVHPKILILSFTHSHVTPNLYKKMLIVKHIWLPLTSIVFLVNAIKSQWELRLFSYQQIIWNE